jgi:hypothetical protein
MMRISIIIAVALAATRAHAEPANEVFALMSRTTTAPRSAAPICTTPTTTARSTTTCSAC